MQDMVCVLSGSLQVAALPFTASVAPCSAVWSTHVMANHLLHGVLHLLPQGLCKNAEQDIWDARSLAALADYSWGFYEPTIQLYLFGL